jgi:predicted RNA-binding Zn ribbon-like protein
MPRTWVLPDEPLPVRLMSTIWAGQDGGHDDFQTPADIDAWLDAVGLDRAGALTTADELSRARTLRDAVRRLAAQLTADTRGDDGAEGQPADSRLKEAVAVTEAVDQVNAAAAALPRPCLTLRDGRLGRGTASAASPVTAGLARVAEQAIDLLTGPDASRLRACYAPGCVLYFIAAHPRRAWCSVACGNRARAARHYEKVRDHRYDKLRGPWDR